MGANLKAVLRRHVATFDAYPTAEVSKAIPGILAHPRTSLYEFDNAITRLAGGTSPPFPFPSAHDYYVWASSHKLLGDVRVPFLALNSDDDPIVTVLPVHAEESQLSPWVVFGVTSKGGHLGWFEEGSTREQPRRWYRRPVLEWLKTMGDEVVPQKRDLPEIKEIDGYMKEVGTESVGYKVLEGSGHVVGIEGEGGLLAGL